MVLESLVIVSILAFLNAFLIIGFYLSCSYNEHEGQIYDKMILWRFHKWVRSIVGDWWAKPVCGCVPCMASLHSIIPFLIIANNNNLPLWIWPLYALTVSVVVAKVGGVGWHIHPPYTHSQRQATLVLTVKQEARVVALIVVAS